MAITTLPGPMSYTTLRLARIALCIHTYVRMSKQIAFDETSLLRVH